MDLRFLPSLLLLTTAAAGAAEVAVVGIFPGKAVLVIDGHGPHTVAVGDTRAGVRVLSVDSDGATVETDGRRLRLAVGHAPMKRSADTGRRVALAPDTRGHYVAMGAVNGRPVRFLVDTGATAVTLSTEFARSLGLDLGTAQPVLVATANGRVIGRRLVLDTVSLGDLVLHRVDAVVQDNLGDLALLGMSFLSRTDLRREGDRLVLARR